MNFIKERILAPILKGINYLLKKLDQKLKDWFHEP